MQSQSSQQHNLRHASRIEELAEDLANNFGVDYATIVTILAISLLEQIVATMPPQQREHVITKACDSTRARLTPARPKLHVVE